MGFGYDPTVFDQQTTPGDNPAIIEEVVADDLKRCPITAARRLIRNLLGLDVGV
jgi:hypothetical protein